MAKLINVYRPHEIDNVDVKKRQYPIRCGENQVNILS